MHFYRIGVEDYFYKRMLVQGSKLNGTSNEVVECNISLSLQTGDKNFLLYTF